MTPPAHLDPVNIPECEKLSKSSREIGTIRDFVEWMQEQGWDFAKGHEHGHQCRDDNGLEGKEPECGYREGGHEPCHERLQDLLYRFFDIDPKKLEKERSALLDRQRELNERSAKTSD